MGSPAGGRRGRPWRPAGASSASPMWISASGRHEAVRRQQAVSTCCPAKHVGQSLEHLGVRQRLHELGLEPSDEPTEDVGGPVWGPTRQSRWGPAPRPSPGCLGRDPTTRTVSPASIPRVSSPANVGHKVQGPCQVGTLHDTGRCFLHPARPHPPAPPCGSSPASPRARRRRGRDTHGASRVPPNTQERRPRRPERARGGRKAASGEKPRLSKRREAPPLQHRVSPAGQGAQRTHPLRWTASHPAAGLPWGSSRS